MTVLDNFSGFLTVSNLALRQGATAKASLELSEFLSNAPACYRATRMYKPASPAKSFHYIMIGLYGGKFWDNIGIMEKKIETTILGYV